MSDISSSNTAPAENTNSTPASTDTNKGSSSANKPTKDFVSNPLTIIGMFCGIAEVAGTTVISFLPKDLQSEFIWFVMGFPVLLLVMFFITLLYKPEALYSPSDYKDEKYFFSLIAEKYKDKFEKSISEVEHMIEHSKKDIADRIAKMLKDSDHDPDEIEKLVESNMNKIYDKLKDTKLSASNFVNFTARLPKNKTSRLVLTALSDGTPATLGELASRTGLKEVSVEKALKNTDLHNLLVKEIKGSDVSYRADLF